MISLFFPKSKHKLLWFGRDLGGAFWFLWRFFFTSQQRSFKRHLLASFTTSHFLIFLPSCFLVFLNPKLEGIIKIKESETLAALKKKNLSPFKLCEHHLKIIYKCVRGGRKQPTAQTPARNSSNNTFGVGDFFDQI